MTRPEPWLERFIAGGLVVLTAVMPFHAFLVVWLGHLVGHEAVWQAWKEVLILVLAAAAAWRYAAVHALRARLQTPAALTAVIFIGLALVITTAVRPAGNAALYGLKTDLEYLVIMLVALGMTAHGLLPRLTRIIIVTGVLTAVIGLALVTLLPRDALTVFGYGPSTIAPYAFVDPAVSAVRTPSTLGGPNQFGGFLILPLCLVAASWVRRYRWWQPLAAALLAGGIWVSYSRAAFIGALLGGIVTVALSLPRRRALQVTGASALLLVVVSAALLLHSSTGTKVQAYLFHQQSITGTDTRASTSQHIISFENGLRAIADHPLGQGLGAAGPASFHSAHPFIPESYYLQLGVETGVAGLLMFLVFVLYVFGELARRSSWGAAAGAAGALVGLSVVSLVLHGWADSSTALVYWIYAGSVLGLIITTRASQPRSVYLAGVRHDDVTIKEVLETIGTMIETHSPGLIATVNAEFVVEAQRNQPFRDAINHAALAVPDGSGATILSRLRGTPLRQRIPGVDLAEQIVAEAAQRGWRVFLLGAEPGVGRAAADIWQQRYPGLVIAGINAGSRAPEAAPPIVAEIRQSRADIILVCFIFPRQELWITENLEATGASVGIGLGGTFNYIAGREKRAPKLFRTTGLEWFYRLITQPWRAKRMLALPKFVWLVARGKR